MIVNTRPANRGASSSTKPLIEKFFSEADGDDEQIQDAPGSRVDLWIDFPLHSPALRCAHRGEAWLNRS